MILDLNGSLKRHKILLYNSRDLVNYKAQESVVYRTATGKDSPY
jgi:hypothetical protein